MVDHSKLYPGGKFLQGQALHSGDRLRGTSIRPRCTVDRYGREQIVTIDELRPERRGQFYESSKRHQATAGAADIVLIDSVRLIAEAGVILHLHPVVAAEDVEVVDVL